MMGVRRRWLFLIIHGSQSTDCEVELGELRSVLRRFVDEQLPAAPLLVVRGA